MAVRSRFQGRTTKGTSRLRWRHGGSKISLWGEGCNGRNLSLDGDEQGHAAPVCLSERSLLGRIRFEDAQTFTPVDSMIWRTPVQLPSSMIEQSCTGISRSANLTVALHRSG